MTDPLLSKRVGTTTVTARLVPDHDVPDPLSDTDCLGRLYLLGQGFGPAYDVYIASVYSHMPGAVPLSVHETADDRIQYRARGLDELITDWRRDLELAGFWVPEGDIWPQYEAMVQELGAFAGDVWARDMATAVLEEYNAWLRGDCWGYIVIAEEDAGAVTEYEEGWGYVGRQGAEYDAYLDFQAVVARITPEMLPQVA